MMTASQQLLVDYAKTGSETAFRELVTRYIDLVFSTALRLVGGDVHRAQDTVQMVFVDLARQAPKLSPDTMLGGWLHRDTCFVAAKVMRAERRRQLRERQAAEMNALNDNDAGLGRLGPALDEAINELGEDDRKAILLRFYERLDLRSVGEALGSSENAAQKRVARALEQLQLTLTRKGVMLPAVALGTTLAGGVVTAAPAGLATAITGVALSGCVAGGGDSFPCQSCDDFETEVQCYKRPCCCSSGFTFSCPIPVNHQIACRKPDSPASSHSGYRIDRRESEAVEARWEGQYDQSLGSGRSR